MRMGTHAQVITQWSSRTQNSEYELGVSRKLFCYHFIPQCLFQLVSARINATLDHHQVQGILPKNIYSFSIDAEMKARLMTRRDDRVQDRKFAIHKFAKMQPTQLTLSVSETFDWKSSSIVHIIFELINRLGQTDTSESLKQYARMNLVVFIRASYPRGEHRKNHGSVR